MSPWPPVCPAAGCVLRGAHPSQSAHAPSTTSSRHWCWPAPACHNGCCGHGQPHSPSIRHNGCVCSYVPLRNEACAGVQPWCRVLSAGTSSARTHMRRHTRWRCAHTVCVCLVRHVPCPLVLLQGGHLETGAEDAGGRAAGGHDASHAPHDARRDDGRGAQSGRGRGGCRVGRPGGLPGGGGADTGAQA